MGFFRYPGIRSILGMQPWGSDSNPLGRRKIYCRGPSIINYPDETISENNLKDKIKYQVRF
ncbi:MAG: hypothetical protein CM1200mP12_23470 [Gammaproteobacteria bacterium]|nr:MAG: hypothetical protein CM1200mP12_23470 [Gammaproteobacteria bacterium]